MNAIRLAVALTLGLALAGCSASGNSEAGNVTDANMMPDVTGLQLDVALKNIEVAGFEDDVAIVGGGTFGVIEESNWTVCEQSPAAGQSIAGPQLTVDRECGMDVVEPTTLAEPAALPPAEQPVAVSSPVAAVEEILTVVNSPELAAVLAEPNYCADAIGAFASTYRGRTIEFDGHIATVNLHPGRETRWDFLISPGEAPGVVGPAFQFRDVGRFELHLTDESIPGLNTGDNLHIVAKVKDFNPDQCLFFLDPVSTGLR